MNEKKDKSVFDIILYGSCSRGSDKPGDVDILVVFREGSLRERLDKVQDIKKKLPKGMNADVKGILWEELFDPNFFARAGVFLDGISILDGRTFSTKTGFVGAVLFIYNIRDKSHTEKVKFNYLLSGRGRDGIVKYLGGKQIAPGVVEMPSVKSAEFEEVLIKHKIEFRKQAILKQS
jgi:predicted nucleotidyltransferase